MFLDTGDLPPSNATRPTGNAGAFVEMCLDRSCDLLLGVRVIVWDSARTRGSAVAARVMTENHPCGSHFAFEALAEAGHLNSVSTFGALPRCRKQETAMEDSRIRQYFIPSNLLSSWTLSLFQSHSVASVRLPRPCRAVRLGRVG